MSRTCKQIDFSEIQRQLILGSLLGDASLNKPPNGINYHWAVYHSKKQRDYLEWKWQVLAPYGRPIQTCAYLDKRDGKTREGGRFHLPTTTWFTDLHRILYPDGKKITPQFLSLIQHPIALATLIGDDGSWDKAGIQIASKQFTEAENALLAFYLGTTFDLRITLFHNEPYYNLRIPADQVAHTRELCLPLLPQSLWYKLGGPNYQTTLTGKIWKHCLGCQREFASYTSANQRFCGHTCASAHKASAWPARREHYGPSGVKSPSAQP